MTAVALLGLGLCACWTPQRLLGMELTLAEFREAMRCPAALPVSSRCVEACWHFEQLVAGERGCRASEDCEVLVGILPLEVYRIAASKQLLADHRAEVDALVNQCGDNIDDFRLQDTRARCVAGRCELVVPERSVLLDRACDLGKAKR